jgi:hypothetical protein
VRKTHVTKLSNIAVRSVHYRSPLSVWGKDRYDFIRDLKTPVLKVWAVCPTYPVKVIPLQEGVSGGGIPPVPDLIGGTKPAA